MGNKWTYERIDCPKCGANVADNWFIKHLKSGCKVGIPVTENPPNNKIKADLESGANFEYTEPAK